MDCLWSAATSLAELQTFQRPAVRGQSSRHRRSLFVTAKSGAGAQCRREKPDTSPRPRTACLADDARHSGTPDPFLCPPAQIASYAVPEGQTPAQVASYAVPEGQVLAQIASYRIRKDNDKAAGG